MNTMTTERACTLLCDMIRCDTINPMGRPHKLTRTVERPLVDLLESVFADTGAVVTPMPVSELHENLEIRIAGRQDGPPLFFESHMDTVPADDWLDTALIPRVDGDIVYGRGACDDKGPLASMVAAVLDILESGEPPPYPVILLAAGDEESAQTGIRQYVSDHRGPYQIAVFGEPTSNVPVIQHKGVVRWDITIRGVSAHTSQPEFGRNAIHDMIKVIRRLADYQDEIEALHSNPLMSGPRINVTRIDGGRTRNAVPDECTIWVDYRIMPGLDSAEERQKVIDDLAQLGLDITHAEPQVAMPPLSTHPDSALVRQAAATSSEVTGRKIAPLGAPYGTDAAWIDTGTPTLVIGPGDIKHAHAIDEFVTMTEVMQCAEIHRRLMMHDWRAE